MDTPGEPYSLVVLRKNSAGLAQRCGFQAPGRASDGGELAYVVGTLREIIGIGQVTSRLRDAVELVEQSRSPPTIEAAREPQLYGVVMCAVGETALAYVQLHPTGLLLGGIGKGSSPG